VCVFVCVCVCVYVYVRFILFTLFQEGHDCLRSTTPGQIKRCPSILCMYLDLLFSTFKEITKIGKGSYGGLDVEVGPSLQQVNHGVRFTLLAGPHQSRPTRLRRVEVVRKTSIGTLFCVEVYVRCPWPLYWPFGPVGASRCLSHPLDWLPSRPSSHPIEGRSGQEDID
jgi:hypothetical protein